MNLKGQYMKNQAFNPILPGWEYIPDGEPHVFGDRVYLYGSHDRFDGDDYCLNNYVCWSAPVDDLSDWTFHGKIYDVTDDPYNKEGKHCGYAPDCCQGPDGRYYLYYALNNHLAMSVAVCDTPAGKYTFLGHVKYADGRVLGTNKGDAYCFDPGVIVDDDNSVHLYMGFSPTKWMPELTELLRDFKTDGCHHIELCSDMVTVKTEPLLIVPGQKASGGTSFEGHGFFEAPSIRKYLDKYYFVYSSEHFQELCYAVSDAPKGPFEYKGRLVSNGDIGIDGRCEPINHIGNNHGGLVEIQGKYYIFYHRHTNMTPYSRQACAEEIEMLPDGTFVQAELTSCGLNGGPLRAFGTYSANIVCNLSVDVPSPPYLTQNGADREERDDQFIANMTNGAFAGFKYFSFKGSERLAVTVKAQSEATIYAKAEIDTDPFAKTRISPCEEAQEFIFEGSVPENTKSLFFSYEGEGSCDIISFRIF